MIQTEINQKKIALSVRETIIKMATDMGVVLLVLVYHV